MGEDLSNNKLSPIEKNNLINAKITRRQEIEGKLADLSKGESPIIADDLADYANREDQRNINNKITKPVSPEIQKQILELQIEKLKIENELKELTS